MLRPLPTTPTSHTHHGVLEDGVPVLPGDHADHEVEAGEKPGEADKVEVDGFPGAHVPEVEVAQECVDQEDGEEHTYEVTATQQRCDDRPQQVLQDPLEEKIQDRRG